CVVRIRVATENVEHWRTCGDGNGGSPRWEISSDDALGPGDCIVETELGSANTGLEAQLRDVEESFTQLLAHRPGAPSRHAARGRTTFEPVLNRPLEGTGHARDGQFDRVRRPLWVDRGCLRDKCRRRFPVQR